MVSGFSGAGKGTLIDLLMKKYDSYALSVSATTRDPRPGEKDGVQYFFKTRQEFEEMIRQDAFIEYAGYVDHYYGTPRAYVEEQLRKGKDVILEIEVQGALEVKKKFPDTLLLFVTPPSAEILKDRLAGRGTETKEVIHSRLARAVEEADGCEVYDYLVVNDDLDACVEEVHHIILSERSRMARRLDTIEEIKNQLKQYVKGEEI